MTQTPAYQRTPSAEKLATYASYKMIIWWLDKNKRTFYSRDHEGSRRVMTDEASLSKLRKYCYQKMKLIETAIIYDNQTGEELFKFRDGLWT